MAWYTDVPVTSLHRISAAAVGRPMVDDTEALKFSMLSNSHRTSQWVMRGTFLVFTFGGRKVGKPAISSFRHNLFTKTTGRQVLLCFPPLAADGLCFHLPVEMILMWGKVIASSQMVSDWKFGISELKWMNVNISSLPIVEKIVKLESRYLSHENARRHKTRRIVFQRNFRVMFCRKGKWVLGVSGIMDRNLINSIRIPL